MPKPSLCLNMIVKNEAAVIERCLRSVLPHVKSAVILDTGSTDDTIARIERACKEAGVWLTIGETTFDNFSQARNEAFSLAQANNVSSAWCQFALLMDADMELVADPGDFDDLNANATSYILMQKGGSISYANTRIVNLDWGKPPYVGVTHEYIDVPTAGKLDTKAYFADHGDGANRAEKYPRDAKLLEDALKAEPDNGRYLYYLGNTYRDWGQPEEAVRIYDKRIALGGWDEETHDAMMRRADCYKDHGNEALFVQGMIAAYAFRPQRAEPLHALAAYYCDKGDNAASLLFSKQGVGMTRPDDLLFVDDFVYDHGLRYQYAVAGYYDPKERNRAFQVTDDLALDPTCPAANRERMRANLFWFNKPLSAYCPSFTDTQIKFTPPAGYTAMNPSVEECNGTIKCNIRCVNYKIDEHGRYMIGPLECNEAPIDTRNFVCTLDQDLSVAVSREVLWDRPAPKFPQVTGLEDVRLYRSKGDLWFSACIREQASNGTCQQVRGKLIHDIGDKFYLTGDTAIMSGEDAIEKNWMPIPNNKHDFMYRLDRVRHPDGTETKHPAGIDVSNISGSSQLIPFRHGFLAVVHEAATDPDGKRTYWHRFAWFRNDGELQRLSLPFVFLDRQIEFCAGLAYHPDKKHLLISYGVRDAEAHIATVAIEEVAQMIWKHHAN